MALFDQLKLMHAYWFPIAMASVTFVLFLIHNAMLNLGSQRKGACISDEFRRTANVLSTVTAYVLCSFANVIFNKLILRAIPLPAFVAAVQMGASCATLLIVNGAVAAILHSRTSNRISSAVWECLCFPFGRMFGSPSVDDKLAAVLAPTSKSQRGGDERESTKSRSCCAQMEGWLCSPEAACGLRCLGMRRWKGIRIGSRHDLWRWIPAAMLHSGAYLLLLEALHRTSVTNVIVWRQLSPLPTMIAECFLTNAVYRTSCLSILGLIALVLGVILYSAADYLSDWLGILFALLSMVLMVWEGLLKRHLLTSSTDPVVLSLQAMVFLNNAVGFVASLTLVLSYELWLFGYKAIPHIRTAEVIYTLCSAFLTSMYHYMGLQLAKAVSASYVLSSTFVSKLAIVIFAGVAMGDTTSAPCLLGLCLALGGNLVYLVSRLQVMAAQELQEQKHKEDGADIINNIREKPEEPQPPAARSNTWWRGSQQA